MTYAQLLAHLQTLSAGDLERTARVLITGQALAICRVAGDDSPILDTGVLAVSLVGAEE